jgi:hypothetical protein
VNTANKNLTGITRQVQQVGQGRILDRQIDLEWRDAVLSVGTYCIVDRVTKLFFRTYIRKKSFTTTRKDSSVIFLLIIPAARSY